MLLPCHWCPIANINRCPLPRKGRYFVGFLASKARKRKTGGILSGGTRISEDGDETDETSDGRFWGSSIWMAGDWDGFQALSGQGSCGDGQVRPQPRSRWCERRICSGGIAVWCCCPWRKTSNYVMVIGEQWEFGARFKIRGCWNYVVSYMFLNGTMDVRVWNFINYDHISPISFHFLFLLPIRTTLILKIWGLVVINGFFIHGGGGGCNRSIIWRHIMKSLIESWATCRFLPVRRPLSSGPIASWQSLELPSMDGRVNLTIIYTTTNLPSIVNLTGMVGVHEKPPII